MHTPIWVYVCLYIHGCLCIYNGSVNLASTDRKYTHGSVVIICIYIYICMGLAQWVCALLCLAVCCSVLKCVAMCCALGAGLHNGCVPSYTRVCTYLCIYVYRHALTICLYSHICIDLFVVYLFIWPWVHVYI